VSSQRWIPTVVRIRHCSYTQPLGKILGSTLDNKLMSDYFYTIRKYFDLKISLFTLAIATAISLMGFWVYPNFICTYGLITVFALFGAMTPILLIWKLYNLSNKLNNKILHVLISIWIGLFFTYITPHQILSKIGEIEWKSAAIKTERYLDHFYTYNGYYPNNLNFILDSFPENESLISTRYLNLIHINLPDTVNSGYPFFVTNDYELSTGFWIADWRIWNPLTRKWDLMF
jgi:hypothetical protein